MRLQRITAAQIAQRHRGQESEHLGYMHAPAVAYAPGDRALRARPSRGRAEGEFRDSRSARGSYVRNCPRTCASLLAYRLGCLVVVALQSGEIPSQLWYQAPRLATPGSI